MICSLFGGRRPLLAVARFMLTRQRRGTSKWSWLLG